MPHPTQSLALLPLLAPLAWLGVALAARRAPGPRPRPLLALADAAGAFTLGVAALSGMLAWRIGPATSPLLGAGGVGLAVRLDALGAVMLALVAFIGAVVVRYSRRYLDGEARQARFVGGLALTLAAVMLLVVAGTLWQLAAAWIGTSLALHRLLLFYPERPGARRAARKKFVVARLGDAALLAALALLALAYGTTDLGTLLARAQDALASGVLPAGTTVAALLLVTSAALKSAQFPTYGWLVEVMETPTPVSALLHAGILNGGPFLVARLAPAVSGAPAAMAALVLLGGATAAIASLAMTTQPSVKVALAYSSAAHMGFSLLLCGLGAFPLAVLHVVAHSCYKAHAFLTSASAVEGAGAGARATRPAPATAPRILLGLLTAALAVAAVARLLGEEPWRRPVPFGLAMLLAIGLTQLVGAAYAGRPALPVLGRTLIGAAATAFAFFLLERGATVLLRDALPPAAPAGGLTLALMAMVVALFAAVVWLQLRLAAAPPSPRWAAAYVHLRNGLYADLLVDRLVGPSRTGTLPPETSR